MEDLYIFGQRAGLVGAREIHSIRAAVASVTANVEDATGLANGVALYVICTLEYLFQLSLNKPLKNLVINTGLQRRRRKTSRCYNMVRKFLILEVQQLKHQLQPWKKPKSICMFKSTISRPHAWSTREYYIECNNVFSNCFSYFIMLTSASWIAPFGPIGCWNVD